jgi:hypothetical protein
MKSDKLIEVIPKLCNIRTKQGGIEPFQLFNWQKEVLANLARRNIILKSRQIGASTLSVAILYLLTIANKGVNSKIIANKKDIAQVLLDTVRIMHDTLPDNIKPKCLHETRFEFFFEGINSRLSISSSTKDAGRGETIHNLLCSEVAFWDNAEEAMLGLLECVPSNGLIIVESTPNGVGNWFHKTYTKAEQKEIPWANFSLPYTVLPEYNSDEWKANKIAEKGEHGFAQEYNCDFVMSRRVVMPDISIDAIEPRRVDLYTSTNIDIILDPVTGKEITKEQADSAGVKYNEDIVFEVIDNPTSPIRLWHEREDGHHYVIGADVAEGLAKGDYSCAYVVDVEDFKVVACWHGHIAPDLFGTELVKMARYYNNAHIACEVNNHGLATLNKVKGIYDNIYYREGFDEIANSYTQKIGWQTNLKTKPLMISELYQSIRDRLLEVHDGQLASELSTFVYDDSGHMNATEGCYDDRVIALAVAVQAYKSII